MDGQPVNKRQDQALLRPGNPNHDPKNDRDPAQSGKITRRKFFRYVGAAAAGGVLAACAPTLTRQIPRTGEKVQLVYQDWRTEWFPEMAQKMLDKFHETHPNIRVFYTPDPDDLEERMLVDMESGTAPDVLSGCCDYFPVWAQKGFLLDLKPYVDADVDHNTIEDWDPAQYQSFFTKDGIQYGLPKYHGALGLFFNKDLFDEYGVEYPDYNWNHDDYLSAMRVLTHDRDQDGKTDLWGSMVDITWDRLQMHVNGWGGHFVDPQDPSRSLMGQPEALSAFEWIRARMWDEKVMASFLDIQNLETRQAFINQQLAMVEDGSWALKDILVNAPFRVGVVPFPSGPARKVTLATTDGFGIYKGTRYPEAAWELMQFLISQDYGRAMASANFLQPARASLVDEWINIIREELPEKAAEVDLAAFADGHRKGYSVTAEIFPNNMAEARQLTDAAWDRIFTLGQAPVDNIKSTSEEIEAAQKQVN